MIWKKYYPDLSAKKVSGGVLAFLEKMGAVEEE